MCLLPPSLPFSSDLVFGIAVSGKHLASLRAPETKDMLGAGSGSHRLILWVRREKTQMWFHHPQAVV